MLERPHQTQVGVLGNSVPQYAHPGDAGADLTSSETITLAPRGRGLVSTDLKIALPRGYVGLIWPRSGLAFKYGIDCGAGVIDAAYRGEIKVLLFNHSDQLYKINKGDRIAQLLVQKVETVQFIPMENLDETLRDQDGFGSTGS